jgi:hypothetical protein
MKERRALAVRAVACFIVVQWSTGKERTMTTRSMLVALAAAVLLAVTGCASAPSGPPGSVAEAAKLPVGACENISSQEELAELLVTVPRFSGRWSQRAHAGGMMGGPAWIAFHESNGKLTATRHVNTWGTGGPFPVELQGQHALGFLDTSTHLISRGSSTTVRLRPDCSMEGAIAVALTGDVVELHLRP